MEIYTIARMFRTFPNIKFNKDSKCGNKSPRNIIYYAGDEHILNIKEFLLKNGGKLIISRDVTTNSDNTTNVCLEIPKYIKGGKESYFFKNFIDEDEPVYVPYLNNKEPWTLVKRRTRKKGNNNNNLNQTIKKLIKRLSNTKKSKILFKKLMNQNTEGIYNQFANNKPWLSNKLYHDYR